MIFFKEKAKEDIYIAKDFYLKINIETGKKFVREIEKSVKLIKEFPDLGSNRYKDYSEEVELKFCILKSFPYMVFYYKENDNIFIIRVLHMSRDLPHYLYF